jgi:asparagine synthase (glutamine-hydrolysing)
MCGIVGVVGAGIERGRCEAAVTALAHRGPDSAGTWASDDGRVFLGHRRLSIVDLSEAGNQPFHGEDGAVVAVCNGEIYNYPALRAELEGRGRRFRSRSDNEAVVHAYAEWGDACVDHMEGMFAFILWDARAGRLLAARDRVGIKPLYWAPRADGVLLASEASALVRLMTPRPEPDPEALAHVMTLGYVPSPGSVWRGVRKLEAGHALTWSAGDGVRTRCYWEPPRELGGDSGKAWGERFEGVLREHLMSDVPVGLFLSGGLDSSSVALGLNALGQKVEALTVGFPEAPSDEAAIAADTARHLGLGHIGIPIRVGDVDRLADQVAAAFDEPQGYSALLPMYLVCREAVRTHKVVLAGDGGDEVLGGYRWYFGLDPLPEARARWMRAALRPVVRRGASPATRGRAMAHFARCSVLHRHAARLFPRFLPEEAEALLAPMGLRFDDARMLAPLERHFEPRLPLARALQRVDLMTFCTDSILAKVDRASMAHSLEVRVPFLDRRIVEWGLSRPEVPTVETESKGVLRGYLDGRVPPAVLEHPKQGFSMRILGNYDWDEAMDRIGEGVWVREGYWSADWERLVAPGVPYRNARLWTLLFLTRWAGRWLGAEAA